MPHTTPLTATRRRSPSWRLPLLTVLVLLAHWAVLRAAPLALASHTSPDAGDSWTFATRTIALEPATRPAPATVRERLAAPAPKPASLRRTLDAAPATPPDAETKSAPAPDEYAPLAIETIATSTTEDAAPNEAAMLLAVATPMARASNAVAAPATAAIPPAAKAVRRFAIPPSARLTYAVKGEVKGFPYYVNGELAWAHDGKTYTARMEISHFLLGSRVQTSTGQLTDHGLEPTRFGDKVRSEVAAHFEREKNKVSFSANTPDAPLLAGAQDQLSIFMQMAAMLGGEPGRFPQGSTLSFQAIGPRSAESWVFTVGASEKLVLPGGELQALRLWRDPSGEFDPKVEIWLAPELGYLPVRIRLTQANGDFVDQQWRATQKP